MRIVLAFNIIIPELCNVGEFTGRHIVGDENCARLEHNHAYCLIMPTLCTGAKFSGVC